MSKTSVKVFLKSKEVSSNDVARSAKELKKFQDQMLRIQQGIWHQKSRVMIAFEGFDASGKGGPIKRIIEPLDPRGYLVHPIGPPLAEEQAKHYLFRFWQKLPEPGTIAIFDRSWYGRVLVEKVNGLVSSKRGKQAYDEINSFEETLINDGIELIKIFLVIDKDEQLRRFEGRLSDPYKNWKLTMEDVKARKQWDQYIDATDSLIKHTSTKTAPWHLVHANDKDYARIRCLEIVTSHLKAHGKWIESEASKKEIKTLKVALEQIGLKSKAMK
jgi:polyphosphate kinase 2 (PPK2 family)